MKNEICACCTEGGTGTEVSVKNSKANENAPLKNLPMGEVCAKTANKNQAVQTREMQRNHKDVRERESVISEKETEGTVNKIALLKK